MSGALSIKWFTGRFLKPSRFFLAFSQQQTNGNGIYHLHLINPQGHITEVKKIVLAP